ncbi:PAS domain S-box-containing protein/diguanylate cyclase (GGDEF)-like protein [Paraburkholderia unamae]|uniref:EAL domain-containing protein n=1 Tax=Paraburkholderia unamae TaxID=219649 RepID=UPI000DC32696|nr:EAL domain-containing protein [Paraburkholderia unamae]RAR56593.1 PAS domain S-box-containing protein/diguanylate cyclase (GGDEF)-like protein [Paraburkholderia unamae]
MRLIKRAFRGFSGSSRGRRIALAFAPVGLLAMLVASLMLPASGASMGLLAALASAAILVLCVSALVNVQALGERDSLVARLRVSEERLSLGFEGINAGLWDWDLVTDRAYYSSYLYRQLGYRDGDLAMDTAEFNALVHPADLARVRESIIGHLKHRSVYDIEYRLRMVDGAYLWCRGRGTAIRDESGRATRIVGCIFDISDLKRAEARVATERSLSDATLASIDDGVIRLDTQANVTYCNGAAERMLGRTAGQVHLRSLFDVCEIYDDRSGDVVTSQCLKNRAADADDVERHLSVARPDGSLLPVACSVSTMRDTEGESMGTVMVLRDASMARKHAAELEYQATHDHLTGLLNRREFERRLAGLLAQGASREQAVMFLDLDQFKVVNDTCGHAAGDEMIRHVSAVLQQRLTRDDILARLGGDEFGVVLPQSGIDHALKVAEDLRLAVTQLRLPWDQRALTTGVSIGVVGVDATLPSAWDIMKAADVACYMAKEKGRNRVHRYSVEDQLQSATHTQMEWVARVKAALDHDRFCLYAQQIKSLKPDASGEESHVELLLRMVDESGALIAPARFIGAAERFNLMPLVDRWVIAHAFDAIAQGQLAASVWSINLSGASLGDESLLAYIVQQQRRCGIRFEQVCFEITETAVITNLSKAIALMESLRALGCRFALDDFGVGMSSFNYLKTLPVDYLKIDGSFVRGITSSELDRTIVQSIHQVAHAAGKATIAEFVESEAIIGRLSGIGIDYVQGYCVGLPEPLPGRPSVAMVA